MKRYALLLLVLPLLVAAGASVPQFKNPAVRDAQAKYEAAKRGYEIALKRGIALAKRQGDEGEVEKMEIALEALDSDVIVPSTDVHGALADALAGSRWDRGGDWIVLNANGTISTSYGDPAGVWRTRGNGEVVMAYGKSVGRTIQTYKFSRDGRTAIADRLFGGERSEWNRQ